MKKTVLVFFLLVTARSIGIAQVVNKQLLIHAKQTENVDAVVLFDKTDFFVENEGQSLIKRHWAVMIFNESGAEDFAYISANYDKFSKVKNIEGYLYDENADKLDKIKTRDTEKVGLGQYESGITDNMVKYGEFESLPDDYPYVVEFSYEKEDKNMLFYPSWIPLRSEDVKVLSSSFVIKTEGIPFRFKEVNTDLPEVIKETTNPFMKSWEIKNYGPVKFEEYSHQNQLPQVYASPQNFEIENYKGVFQQWEDISAFYSNLNEGRDHLPVSKVNELKALIKPEMDNYKKIKTTYEFMQSHTRYVSIQLGIGGWQSMTATEVAEKGFGDCKALTNYTIALLKTIGIKAYPALIKAGGYYDPSLEDFPSMQFNHVIACVPVEKDTLWLECTSQTESAGYLGDFTGNRKALIIKPESGKLVNTIQYEPKDNFQHRMAEVWLEKDGKAKVKIDSKYGGIQHDRRAYVSSQMDETEQRKFLQSSIDLPTFDLKDFSFQLKKQQIPTITEKAEVEVRKLASTSGKRIFLKTNILSNFYKTPPKTEERITKLFLNPSSFTFEDTDDIIFHLPEGLTIETLPKEASIESIFGRYQNSYTREGNILKYHREVSVAGGEYEKEDYEKWLEFVKDINRADRARVVFLTGGT
ncbi:DUF3857 domain-containing protein [Jiulongibacter sediminis]|uniref:DUF3857 domain-containing protein n=1 Tax=Jiulongibacter sediminis TaxID=1605367 RepID=A0A0N8H9Q0_9BACT|nr:DUF3857 domain-containing protein [Jiulongibacter sediminis]KPM47988.1 hypothetical protein AFM12_12295 [Jiulongibacter sediminis]TBX24171.1 hypothetical protein TK44_12305 [Jiulongibacter sediminis]